MVSDIEKLIARKARADAMQQKVREKYWTTYTSICRQIRYSIVEWVAGRIAREGLTHVYDDIARAAQAQDTDTMIREYKRIMGRG